VTNDLEIDVPDVEVISLGRKAHYAEGVNVGIKRLSGHSILILNDDTILAPDCLEEIIAESDDSTILQPQICLKTNQKKIDNIGHRVWPDGANFGHNRGQRHDTPAQKNLLVFSGAAFTLPPDVYNSVGAFDPHLSPFGEDVDYALRAIRRGWKIKSCVKAKVYHQLGASYGRQSMEKIFWVERHRILLMLKSAPPALLFTMPLSSTLRYAIQFVGALNDKGSAPPPSSGLPWTLVKAYFSAIRSSRRMLNCRKEEHHEWTLNNQEMLLKWRRQLPSLSEIWHPRLGS
jgi:GT2 family glycosyltransferase